MTYRHTLSGLLLLSVLFTADSPAQCSDAGVCSLGGVEEQDHVLIFSAAASYGSSKDDDLSFTDVLMGLQAFPTEALFVSAALPYRSMTGPLGSTSGIGDLLLTARYTVWSNDDLSASLEGGIRFATGAVNERSLPQAYQPGLGTTDALLGVSLMGDRWSASAGYQYAPGRSANSVNTLRRGDDISFRGTYLIYENDLRVRGEAIMIHKLQESNGTYLNTMIPGGSDIPDTDRTQINLVGDISYPIQQNIMLNIRAAMALLSRPVNVDGLKRNFTVQAGLSIPLL